MRAIRSPHVCLLLSVVNSTQLRGVMDKIQIEHDRVSCLKEDRCFRNDRPEMTDGVTNKEMRLCKFSLKGEVVSCCCDEYLRVSLFSKGIRSASYIHYCHAVDRRGALFDLMQLFFIVQSLHGSLVSIWYLHTESVIYSTVGGSSV